MIKKGKPIVLLVLVLVLLVLVSSRINPKQAMRTGAPTVTDDPEPLPDELPETTPEPTPTPTPAPQVHNDLPNLSKGDWELKLVNNTYVLSNTFAPNVKAIRDDQYFDERAADKLEEMLSAAEAAGYSVCVRNAYRPFSTQAYLFNGRASQIQWGTTMTLLEAEKEARKIVAYPGTSEHQLGLAADIMDNKDTVMKAEEVETHPLLLWLKEHCTEYGFILRYPKDKQEITGWWEPWHFRYVGVDAANYMKEHNLCLEEFIAMF